MNFEANAHLISAAASIATAIITLIGLVSIYFQLRTARRAIEAQTRANIASAEAEIQKVMMQYPSLRNMLFSQIELDERSDEANRLILHCATNCDFFDYFLLEENFAGSRSREAYLNYARNLIDKSLALRRFIERNRRYYSSELGSFLDAAIGQGSVAHQ